MARPPHKRGRGASDLGGALTGLLRSTLAQAGVVRDAIERGARTGRARLDEALGDAAGDRRRVAALAELGEIVLELVRDGEIDLTELPEIEDVVARIDRLDDRGAEGPRRARRGNGAARGAEPYPARWRADGAERIGQGEASDDELTGDFSTQNVPPLAARFYDRYTEEQTAVGIRQRQTTPLPRRRVTEPMSPPLSARERRPSASPMAPLSRPAPFPEDLQDDEDDELDELDGDLSGRADDDLLELDELASREQLAQARRAVTQPMRAVRPPSSDGELELAEDASSDDDPIEAAPWAKRVAWSKNAVDGTVSSASWQPPAPRSAEPRVWRPNLHDAGRIPIPYVGDDGEDDKTNDSRPVTARVRPMESQPVSQRRTPAKGTEIPMPPMAELGELGIPTLADASSPAIAPTLAPAIAPTLAPAIAPTLAPAVTAEPTTAAGTAPPSPANVHMPLAELRTLEDEPAPAAGARDPLSALTERSPFGAKRGGISFDDDLDEYMHPDDVPARER